MAEKCEYENRPLQVEGLCVRCSLTLDGVGIFATKLIWMHCMELTRVADLIIAGEQKKYLFCVTNFLIDFDTYINHI